MNTAKTVKLEALQFQPIPCQRVWGGHDLKQQFGLTNIVERVGEYWVLSGHPSQTSVVMHGPMMGQTLNDVIAAYPEAYLGVSPQPRFPLLIKFLEANQDLSVQIHPDNAYAQMNEGDFGKTEAWYVLSTKPKGTVVYGHTFPSREAYTAAVAGGQVRDYLSYRGIVPGDVVLVPSRTLHALLGGTMVIEVQQTSDLTYRVYDWDRLGDDGLPRQLHVEKAADVMKFGGGAEAVDGESQESTGTAKYTALAEDALNRLSSHRVERVVACAYFTMDSVSLEANTVRTMSLGHAMNPDILIVASGEVTYEADGQVLNLRAGDTLLIPSTCSRYTLQAVRNALVLRTFY